MLYYVYNIHLIRLHQIYNKIYYLNLYIEHFICITFQFYITHFTSENYCEMRKHLIKRPTVTLFEDVLLAYREIELIKRVLSIYCCYVKLAIYDNVFSHIRKVFS